jgi:hypothetical protein
LIKETVMRVLYINNDGAGFADTIDLAEGTTVAQLFAQRLPGRQPADYLIRVNRLPAAADQRLHEGDRISITPVKIEGAQTANPTLACQA